MTLGYIQGVTEMAKANELKKKQLTKELLYEMYLDKWDGALPKVQSDNGMMLDISSIE